MSGAHLVRSMRWHAHGARWWLKWHAAGFYPMDAFIDSTICLKQFLFIIITVYQENKDRNDNQHGTICCVYVSSV